MVLLVNSLDIEASCGRPVPGSLLSVGACLYEVARAGRQGTVLTTFRMNVAWPGGAVFDTTTRAFWCAAPDALAQNQTDGKPPEEVALALSAFLEECQALAARRNATYQILTDNRQFDVGWLEWFLATYAPPSTDGRPTASTVLRSRVLGSLHDNIVDLRQRQQGLKDLGIKIDWRWAQCPERADHTPLRDAIVMARRYEFYLHYVQSQRRKIH